MRVTGGSYSLAAQCKVLWQYCLSVGCYFYKWPTERAKQRISRQRQRSPSWWSRGEAEGCQLLKWPFPNWRLIVQTVWVKFALSLGEMCSQPPTKLSLPLMDYHNKIVTVRHRRYKIRPTRTLPSAGTLKVNRLAQSHTLSIQKISYKSVHNFFSYLVHNQSDRQTISIALCPPLSEIVNEAPGDRKPPPRQLILQNSLGGTILL